MYQYMTTLTNGLLLTFGRNRFTVVTSGGGDEVCTFADVHLFELCAAFFNKLLYCVCPQDQILGYSGESISSSCVPRTMLIIRDCPAC